MAKAKNWRRLSAIRDYLWENGASTSAEIARAIREHKKWGGYDMLTDTVAQLMVGDKNIRSIGTIKYRVMVGGGKVNLWELTPEYRKQRCDEMLQEMSELRMENGKLKANLSAKEKKIQRLEAFEKAVEKSKKRKYRSAKKMLDDTMELWDTHGVILSLLTKGDKSTSQILNSKRIQFSRVTLLKRLRELEAKGMVKSNEHWGKDRRGRMLVWTITEHDPYNHTGEVLRWI